ncbi:S1 family peptidase [Roseimaritima ulvae]|uniref:S1 family peptidase n=1 Tax=Roseimaritima ulvae TaxID=980254 RepID=UPI00138FD2B8|nr:serine protease [Roseimaritima ulvae]
MTIEHPRKVDRLHAGPSGRANKWRKVSLSTVPKSVIQAASATVRVRFPAGNGDNVGTGVYLGDGLYLTAFHVGRGTSGKGTVSFRDGGYDHAVAVKSDPDADLLLLQGSIRAEMPCVALHDANLQQGDMAFLAGTAKGSLDMWHGPVTGYWDTDTGASDWMSIDGSATEGDSGGPVFTETGRLCGVLWGGDGRETMASNCGRIRRFLLPWNARLAAWQESQCQGSVCYPSQIPHQQPRQQRLPTAPNRQTIPSTGQPTPVPSGVARQPSASPSVPQISDEAIAAHLFDQMKNHSALFKGEKGDKGEPGPKGDPGPEGQITSQHLKSVVFAVTDQLRNDSNLKGEPGKDGRDGVSPTLDIDAIAAQVLARLPPIPVQTYDRQNQLIDTEYYPFGTPIKLRYGLVE